MRSEKEAYIFDYIRMYIENHSYAPTIREISNAVNYSCSEVHKGMKYLFDIGVLETDTQERAARSYRIKGMTVRIPDLRRKIK